MAMTITIRIMTIIVMPSTTVYDYTWTRSTDFLGARSYSAPRKSVDSDQNWQLKSSSFANFCFLY